MIPLSGDVRARGLGVPLGLRQGPVTVRVPGSTANLGPGFDAVALALGYHDEVVVEAVDPGEGVVVEVAGEGAGRVDHGEAHLVVRCLRAALARAGAAQPGLRMRCRNGVPHGRGVGSSAAAVVAGVVAGAALLDRGDGGALGPDDLLDLACGVEGHADNAAASLLGGLTLGWRDAGPPTPPDPSAGAAAGRWRAVRLDPHPDLAVVLAMPPRELATARARAMLPEAVSHADAAFTAGRCAVLVEALTRRPDLLLAATDDRIHQRQRAAAMPESWRLIGDLRAAGVAAAVSGAGPTVLAVTTRARCRQVLGRVGALVPGWTVAQVDVAAAGAVVLPGAGA